MMESHPQTSNQVARGARADGQSQGVEFLIKPFERLRLTYQIRLLTAHAIDAGTRLQIVTSKSAVLSSDLRKFVSEHEPAVLVRRVDFK